MTSTNNELKKQEIVEVNKRKETPPKSQNLEVTGMPEQGPSDSQLPVEEPKAAKNPEVVPDAVSAADEVPKVVTAPPNTPPNVLISKPGHAQPRTPTPSPTAPNAPIISPKPTPMLNQILGQSNPQSTTIAQQHMAASYNSLAQGNQLVLHPASNTYPIRLIRFLPHQLRQQYMKQPDPEQTQFFKSVQFKHDQLIRKFNLPARHAIQNISSFHQPTHQRAITGGKQEPEDDSDEINKIIKKLIQKAVDEKNQELEKKNKELENWAKHYKTCFDLNSMLYVNNAVLSMEAPKLRNEIARRAENEKKLKLEIERKQQEIREMSATFKQKTNALVDENLLVRFECQTEINENEIKMTLQTVELEKARAKNSENKAELERLSEKVEELKKENERAKDEYVKSIHEMAKKLNAEVEEKMREMTAQKEKEIEDLKCSFEELKANLSDNLENAKGENLKLTQSLQEETAARKADQLSWDEMWRGVIKDSEDKHALELRAHEAKIAELEAKILKQDGQLAAYKERDAALADCHRKNLLRTKRMYESEKKLLEEYEKATKVVDDYDEKEKEVEDNKNDVKDFAHVTVKEEKPGCSKQLKVEEKKEKSIKSKEVVPDKKIEKKTTTEPGTSGTQKRHLTSSGDHKEKKIKKMD
ncbi:hypothetical protein CRE_06533 [Caenorhabditis remanei]|uniref:Uncharacterized protein n=1 Tax=Caenorhabditis remanei TaxID=31234 RepID=E3M1F6_CAERE|nr:hypothetical protein CRE_06533 [Caenorhabditis remanei]